MFIVSSSSDIFLSTIDVNCGNGVVIVINGSINCHQNSKRKRRSLKRVFKRSMH